MSVVTSDLDGITHYVERRRVGDAPRLLCREDRCPSPPRWERRAQITCPSCLKGVADIR